MTANIKQKRGLGRGLNAIFATPDSVVAVESKLPAMNDMAQVAIQNIRPNPKQPRRAFDEAKLRELSESIEALGVIQPITLKKEGDEYIIISGERRWRAAQAAGLRTMPAYIREVDDERLHTMALVENIQREDLNPMEIALSLQRVMDECGVTQEALAVTVSMKRPTIANYLRLLRLADGVQLAIKEGVISMGHAKAIATIESHEMQIEALRKIVEMSLSVRQSEELARAMQRGEQVAPEQKSAPAPESDEEYPESYSRLVERMERLFSQNISIKRGKQGGGKIVIDFKSDEEIDSFISRMDNRGE